ncbi:B3 domain-containing protein REM10-like isoform X1 [Lycium ferocissimum]|uniref:B3 domain-containing protein REM10-like isoform X1 n=1 Tax=Lycium ferocissimum TaxID=112874 RepID=UPI002814B4CC|nr:B3 domain-containing protein REM10-like isoform X1 [Lycium ferocissimum]
MKVPPKKPHFFKPILPGFKNGLKIPIGFFKYLKGHDQYKHAILRRAGKKWLVKVNGQRLEDGNWKEFVEQHDLQLGDILVFKHEGDMEFEVSIFHSSHCEREYAEHLQEEKDEDKEAVTLDKSFGQSHCECIIRQYSLLRGYMCLPQQFIKMNGLTNKKCGLIVRNEGQRSWNLKLSSNNTRAHIGDGWRKFIAENCLKEGDRIVFEIVRNGETPIWKFQVITDGELPVRKFQAEKPSPSIELSNKDSSHAEAATNKPFVQSRFESSITPYWLSRGLNLPKQFVFANGLIDKKCDLIIRDERQRSWNLKLRYWRTEVYIEDGSWRKFSADNSLKEGDRIKFEVVSNGDTPIWKYQVADAEIQLQKFQGKFSHLGIVKKKNSRKVLIRK